MPRAKVERTLRLFTIGYEGRTPPDLIAALHAHRVTRLIDVRELPLSRRPGFSKTALAAALAAAEIDYVHLRAAGNPFRHRADPAASLAAYAARLDAEPQIVDEVIRAATGRRAALLCVEAAADSCHRSRLSAQIARRVRTTITDL